MVTVVTPKTHGAQHSEQMSGVWVIRPDPCSSVSVSDALCSSWYCQVPRLATIGWRC